MSEHHPVAPTRFEDIVRDAAIPIGDGLQAQGDLLVVPYGLVADTARVRTGARWRPVTPSMAVPRSAHDAVPHTLVADRGRCEWTWPEEIGLYPTFCVVETEVTLYVMHPAHAALGIAPGRYVLRGQRDSEGVRTSTRITTRAAPIGIPTQD